MIPFLSYKAYRLRLLAAEATSHAGSGHVTSCLSAADIGAVIFFYAMKQQKDYTDELDSFILSKGHAAPLLYAAYVELGIITEDELFLFRSFESNLEGHPTVRAPLVNVSTGSLGQGISIAAGYALADHIDKKERFHYVLLGDGEMAEGSIWEAAAFASHYALDSIIACIDCNRLGQSEATMEQHHVEQFERKFQAFGWRTLTVDGHDIAQLMHAYDCAKERSGKPTMIIAKTVKGYGIKSVEDKIGYHGKPFKMAELPAVQAELRHRFFPSFSGVDVAAYQTKMFHIFPPQHVAKLCSFPPQHAHYKQTDLVATRSAFGEALVVCGTQLPELCVLDAEVKNSTYTEYFEQKFPHRFTQCFIAEQNMVSVGLGLSKSGKRICMATFAAFFTRAFDQIRMAALSNASLTIAGSHVGVSIGEDGPSQMGLEDIALFRSIPHSTIVYPSDARSAFLLTQEILQQKGIGYIRLTRMATPILYEQYETFSIGALKIVRSSANDTITIVAAGITVYAALHAYDFLRKQGIYTAVIDCYSVQPLPLALLIEQSKKTNNMMLIVEDHYLAGGLGESIIGALKNHPISFIHLYVKNIGRSGSPEALMRYEHIDAHAIAQAIIIGNRTHGA